MSRGLVAILILGCVLVLAGCREPLGRERVTDTDRQRLQVMLDEPIIRGALQDVSPHPGTLLRAKEWGRGSVSASISSRYADERGAVSPEETEGRTAEALGVLRATGWTIMSASCTVPAPPSPEPNAGSADDFWTWRTTAYKHIDGVSYWTELTGGAVPAGGGYVDITLRAPNVDDPPDLFADRPPNLSVGSTCIEQPGVAAPNVEQGSPVVLYSMRSPDRPSTPRSR